MSISVLLISTPEKAENLIRMASRERKYFQARRDLIDLSAEDSAETVVKTQQEMLATQSQMDYLTALIRTMPEGDQKYDEVTKLMALEVKMRKLTATTNKDPVQAQLEKEFEALVLEGQISSIDTYVEAVTARKVELESATS